LVIFLKLLKFCKFFLLLLGKEITVIMDCKTKCAVTGYAMQTIAGDEKNFNMNQTKGFTDPMSNYWAVCIDTSSMQMVCRSIKDITDRALIMANINPLKASDVGLIVSSNFFETSFWEENNIQSIKASGNYISNFLKRTYNIKNLVISNSMACVSGANAIVTACQALHDNKSKIVIVVAYDIKTKSPENGLKTLGALSKDKISPFSINRTGTDLADGIGVIILEKVDDFKSKNAVAYILGYGICNDAYNVTSPEPEGKALEMAMNKAISMANISKDSIQYINVHGTGTKLNDELETRIIKKIFKKHAYKLYINSSKSLIGHTLGAGGLIELILTIMQMNRGEIHPTANFNGFDPNCDLHYCFEKSIKANIKYSMTNSIGFGGTNVSILLENGHVK